MWNHDPRVDAYTATCATSAAAMLRDLPSDTQLIESIGKAMAFDAAFVKLARPSVPARPGAILHGDRAALLGHSKRVAARQTWVGVCPGKQRQPVDWITAMKTDTTRQRRLAPTLEWLGEGSQQPWKYVKC